MPNQMRETLKNKINQLYVKTIKQYGDEEAQRLMAQALEESLEKQPERLTKKEIQHLSEFDLEQWLSSRGLVDAWKKCFKIDTAVPNDMPNDLKYLKIIIKCLVLGYNARYVDYLAISNELNGLFTTAMEKFFDTYLTDDCFKKFRMIKEIDEISAGVVLDEIKKPEDMDLIESLDEIVNTEKKELLDYYQEMALEKKLSKTDIGKDLHTVCEESKEDLRNEMQQQYIKMVEECGNESRAARLMFEAIKDYLSESTIPTEEQKRKVEAFNLKKWLAERGLVEAWNEHFGIDVDEIDIDSNEMYVGTISKIIPYLSCGYNRKYLYKNFGILSFYEMDSFIERYLKDDCFQIGMLEYKISQNQIEVWNSATDKLQRLNIIGDGSIISKDLQADVLKFENLALSNCNRTLVEYYENEANKGELTAIQTLKASLSAVKYGKPISSEVIEPGKRGK